MHILEVYLIVVCVVVVSVSYLALLTNFCVSQTCMETYMLVIKDGGAAGHLCFTGFP